MEAIRWGVENRQHALDFGRTDLGHEGLPRSRAPWGAEETPLRYSYLGTRVPDSTSGVGRRMIHAAIRRAPAPFGRLAGGTLYRHLG
jgi:hypothetical protein